MVALDKIPMIDNLRRWGLILVNWYCLCKKSEETINHPLIHCEFTRVMVPGSHDGHYFRVTSLLEDTRAATIQRGYLESHSFFAYVDHLERKK